MRRNVWLLAKKIWGEVEFQLFGLHCLSLEGQEMPKMMFDGRNQAHVGRWTRQNWLRPTQLLGDNSISLDWTVSSLLLRVESQIQSVAYFEIIKRVYRKHLVKLSKIWWYFADRRQYQTADKNGEKELLSIKRVYRSQRTLFFCSGCGCPGWATARGWAVRCVTVASWRATAVRSHLYGGV